MNIIAVGQDRSTFSNNTNGKLGNIANKEAGTIQNPFVDVNNKIVTCQDSDVKSKTKTDNSPHNQLSTTRQGLQFNEPHSDSSDAAHFFFKTSKLCTACQQSVTGTQCDRCKSSPPPNPQTDYSPHKNTIKRQKRMPFSEFVQQNQSQLINLAIDEVFNAAKLAFPDAGLIQPESVNLGLWSYIETTNNADQKKFKMVISLNKSGSPTATIFSYRQGGQSWSSSPAWTSYQDEQPITVSKSRLINTNSNRSERDRQRKQNNIRRICKSPAGTQYLFQLTYPAATAVPAR